jgi:hypothetical protein
MRAQGRRGSVQARTAGVSTLGVDRGVVYKVEAYCPRPEGLASRFYLVSGLFLDG